MAESFSKLGVPVFLADVKGDLSGMIQEGKDSDDMIERKKRFKIEDTFTYEKYPVNFFDIFQKGGIPLRTTISEMGPQLLSTVLGLNDTQSDVLAVTFKIADDQELLLTDTKDLKAMLNYVSDHHDELKDDYGNMAPQSIAAIIRAIVALEGEGADIFFGEPAINVSDLFLKDTSGKGYINILDSSSLINRPKLYSAFMLYLLSELFEVLPKEDIVIFELKKTETTLEEAFIKLIDTVKQDNSDRVEKHNKKLRKENENVLNNDSNEKQIKKTKKSSNKENKEENAKTKKNNNKKEEKK